MRKASPLLLLLVLTASCEDRTAPLTYNAGRWESLPFPGGSTTVYELDTAGTRVRGAGEYGGFAGQPFRPLSISGTYSADTLHLTFRYADRSTATYEAVFATPTRLVGRWTRGTGVPVDSVVYLQH